MSSDFGLRGPKTSWVCPSDRQLALRAKVRTGWSLNTNQFNTYPKPQPLTEKEQQAIVSVIKRAEELELYEQQRVGKLVNRLEIVRRLASGNGLSECVLCGDSFGISSYRCADCKKAVCRKCVVDLTTTVPTSPAKSAAGSSKNVAPGPSSTSSSASANAKESIIRLCKLCAENREFIKKSGAWFYKGIPKYVLSEKRNNHYHRSHAHLSPVQSNTQEQKYISRYISDSQVSTLSSEDSGNKTVW